MEILLDNVAKLSNAYENLKLSKDLPNHLDNISDFTTQIFNLSKLYIDVLHDTLNYIKYKSLVRRKNHLIKEGEFIKLKSKNAEFNAKKDLLRKLEIDLEKHKKELNFLSKDFLHLKSKNDEKSDKINQLKAEIEDLNRRKKDAFDQINKIVIDLESENPNSRSQSKNIKNLQKDAKEYQYQIKKITKQIETKNKEYKAFLSNFNKLNEDYSRLNKIVQQDEEKIGLLKNEIKQILQENKGFDIKEGEDLTFFSSRSENEVKEELKALDAGINRIKHSKQKFQNGHTNALETLNKTLTNLDSGIENLLSNDSIDKNYDEIIASTEQFIQIESFLRDLESNTNDFLFLINLKCNFDLVLNEDANEIMILIHFFRTNKEIIEFESLTTPEKVFFLIAFYIGYQITIKKYDIVFFNLRLPVIFNKKGSIFRAIKKISEFFQKDEKYSQYRLIFIISSFLPSNKIENVKIIEINEKKM